jgi:hypothetical protein
MRLRLTQLERDALRTAAGFLLAGEWGETITEKEAKALERALVKLMAADKGKVRTC